MGCLKRAMVMCIRDSGRMDLNREKEC